MPIPLILGAIAIGSALFGGAKTVEGFGNMNHAKEIGEDAQKRYEYFVREVQADQEATNDLAMVWREIIGYDSTDFLGIIFIQFLF